VSAPENLDQLSEELEAVADKLRSGAVDPDEGADLVERCAELAARLGYDGVELMVGMDEISQDISAVAKLRDYHQIPVVAVHTPCLLLTQRVWGTDPWVKLLRAQAAAEAELFKAGLRAQVVEEVSDKTPGTVIAQNPRDTAKLKRGEPVEITVAIAPEPEPSVTPTTPSPGPSEGESPPPTDSDGDGQPDPPEESPNP